MSPEYNVIPSHMIQAIQRYVELGEVPSSDFLRAVISNNLKESVARADDSNVLILRTYVRYFYNCCPMQCWGSPEAMVAWQELFRERTTL